jgi:hypothetical protein
MSGPLRYPHDARKDLLLTALHVVGVLRHQLTRSNVLRRMGLNVPLGKA